MKNTQMFHVKHTKGAALSGSSLPYIMFHVKQINLSPCMRDNNCQSQSVFAVLLLYRRANTRIDHHTNRTVKRI